MKLRILFFSLLPGLALAQGPNDPDFYNTVAEIYSGVSCSNETFIWVDPIFGRGGVCQKLDRNDNTPDILSYRVVQTYPGCSATLYTDDKCLGTPYPAPESECIQIDKPFLMAFVDCPFS